MQVQHVRDPARCDGSVCSGGCVRVPRARGKHMGELESRQTHKDACEIGEIGASRAHNLGSVQRSIRLLEEHTLLWIHGHSFGGCYAEHGRVE